MQNTNHSSVTITWLDEYAALHVIWGSWLDAGTIQRGTQRLAEALQQRQETQFVLFDLTHTQHFSLQHMALYAVELYDYAAQYEWLLAGDIQQVRPCEAILHTLADQVTTRHFSGQASALAYLRDSVPSSN